MNGKVLVAAVTACITLVGCVGAPYKAYAPAQDASIKSIVLLTPMNPPDYILLNQGSGAKAFGLIGALADASGDRAKTGKLDDLLKADQFDFGAAFSQALQQKLQGAGYTVSIEKVDRKKPMAMAKYAGGNATAAVIDTGVWHVGYANESITDQDFRPAIKVDVQLTSKGKTLYSEALMYGYHNPFMKGTELDAPKEYYFDGYDKLVSDPGKLRKGLDLGIDVLSSHVVDRLTGTTRVTKAQ
jgi:hypothetical protein